MARDACVAPELSGYWKHPEDQVWPDFDEAPRVGIAVRNDNDPSTAWFKVLKELVADSKQGQ